MTKNLQEAEAAPFDAKQSTFRAYLAATGTEAEAAARSAYSEAFHAYVVALDEWTRAKVKG